MNLVLTNEKWLLILVNIVFGAVLLFSYYKYINFGGVDLKTLWGKAYSVKKLYLASVYLAALAYALLLFFAIFKTVNTKRNNAILSNLTIIQVLIIVISMLWLPLTLVYLKEGKKPFAMLAVLIVLFIVGIASFKQIRLIQNLVSENTQCAKMTQQAAVVGAGVFFIHTFFFDFIGWSCGFFA